MGKTAANIRKITIRTHEACLRIIDKKGPLSNPADRDHCVQYMIAIPLLFGRLTAEDYEDQVAVDAPNRRAARQDGLRGRACSSRRIISTRRNAQLGTSLPVVLADGTSWRSPWSTRSDIERRRKEGMPLLVEKFKRNLARRFGEEQQQRILDASLDREQLERMPVSEYVDLYVV